jgi:AraC-like DNA-binding protein
MSSTHDHQQLNPITYSCYSRRVREGEQFISNHVFSFQISGTLAMTDGATSYIFQEDSFRLTRRNSLLKFTKQPGAAGEYKNLSVFMDQQTLKELSQAYKYEAAKHIQAPAVITVPTHELLRSYVRALEPYDELISTENVLLQNIKVKELVFLLLTLSPELKDVLFDFSEPGKLDLEAFMNKNYRFNVSLERFAYLTGRSLSTFKRDFEKIFSTRPGKWLQERRLQEAYFLIKEKGVAPKEVYVDVGFEDLSHFSFAFKKMYGVAPSKMI